MTEQKKWTIALGGDHAGYTYKKAIIEVLVDKGYTCLDKGTFAEDSVDYPDFVHPTALSLIAEEADFGILICGSGNGVAMTANKHEQIRAALCWTDEIAALARQHNNANMVALPARYISLEEAKTIVNTFLHTEFEGGRHQRRVDKIPYC